MERLSFGERKTGVDCQVSRGRKEAGGLKVFLGDRRGFLWGGVLDSVFCI
jgi:hypothetical protein